MSLLKAWKSVGSIHGTPDGTPKKNRFSLFPRPSPRRTPPVPRREFSDSDSSFGSIPHQDLSEARRAVTVLEHDFTLSILEGRKAPGAARDDAPPRTSTASTETCVSDRPLARTVSHPVAPRPPPVPPRSKARRAASISPIRSEAAQGRQRPRRRPQTLSVPVPVPPVPRPDEATLPPAYSSAVGPTRGVTYRFAQAGALVMTLTAEGDQKGGADVQGYHIAAQLDVLTLRSWVTSVRRGGEDGLLVAEIESGLTTGRAAVTMGDGTRSSRDVLSRTPGSKMYYVGDGTAIRWRLGEAKWEAFFDSVELATFDPGAARTLVVQPLGYRFFDHLVVGVLLLVREREDAACSRAGAETATSPPPFKLG
ncbi:hypothetical protein C8Q79DRAFT_109085 [Trametes meyenii]|nr:hypothetical protein C8Q79DRAFT_109085 [Trametes meyenii]